MNTFPQGAIQYSEFLEQSYSQAGIKLSRVREPETPFIPELELQALWFGGELGCKFTGTQGEEVVIRDFGHWNHAAGPDFTDVSIQVDGEIRNGDLEIDLSCRSWEEHGHGANEAFDNVVLHIFISPSAMPYFTRTSRHKQIPQVQLPRLLLNHARVRDLPEAHPGRCLPALRGMEGAAITSLLESAAQYRLQTKSQRIRAIANASTENQAIYQLLGEALGYRKNRLQMILLAQRNPIKQLQSIPTMQREACLLGSASFIGDPPRRFSEVPSPLSTYLRQLWDEWWKIRPEVEVHESRQYHWVLNGSRPLNHPQRRVGALAMLVEHWSSIQQIWEQPHEKMVADWLKACANLSHPFWDYHYTLKSVSSEKPIKLIGPDRARDFLGNIIFPHIIGKDPNHWSMYREMRGSGQNQKLRRAGLRLFGEASEQRKYYSRYYYQQQGLLQIFQDFCLTDDSGCKECPFPEQLKQWEEKKVLAG